MLGVTSTEGHRFWGNDPRPVRNPDPIGIDLAAML